MYTTHLLFFVNNDLSAAHKADDVNLLAVAGLISTRTSQPRRTCIQE
jgi:hypothetical protein